MENENELVEDLFETEDNKVSNAFADLPPVAPVNYEENIESSSDKLNNELPNTNDSIYDGVTEDNSNPNGEENNINIQNRVNYENEVANDSSENREYIAKEVLENPNAKVILNQEKEEEISKGELQELKNIKLSDNSSLKFVFFLGIIFLIAIFIIPFISKYI